MPYELISMKNVSKQYRDRNRKTVQAISDLSLSIYAGETLGLVGESGCGKSTAGNLLVHLLKPDQGSITFRGQEISDMSERRFHPLRREIQMVFQDPYSSLNPRKKIGWLMEEPLKIHEQGMGREERRRRVEELLEEVGLDREYADRYPRELSGGQRQRVSIALALMVRPAFIVADEPVSALDVSVQAQILNLMKELQEKHNLTYLFISHDLGVVSYLSDRIGVMYLGRLVELGTTRDILESPLHPYTKALFDASRQVLQGEVPSPSSPPSGCPFHTRCPHCMERCKTDEPPLCRYGDGHMAACHLLSAE